MWKIDILEMKKYTGAQFCENYIYVISRSLA